MLNGVHPFNAVSLVTVVSGPRKGQQQCEHMPQRGDRPRRAVGGGPTIRRGCRTAAATRRRGAPAAMGALRRGNQAGSDSSLVLDEAGAARRRQCSQVATGPSSATTAGRRPPFAWLGEAAAAPCRLRACLPPAHRRRGHEVRIIHRFTPSSAGGRFRLRGRQFVEERRHAPGRARVDAARSAVDALSHCRHDRAVQLIRVRDLAVRRKFGRADPRSLPTASTAMCSSHPTTGSPFHDAVVA